MLITRQSHLSQWHPGLKMDSQRCPQFKHLQEAQAKICLLVFLCQQSQQSSGAKSDTCMCRVGWLSC